VLIRIHHTSGEFFCFCSYIYIYFFYVHNTYLCVRFWPNRSTNHLHVRTHGRYGQGALLIEIFSRLGKVKLTIGQVQILKWSYITYYWTYRVDTWTSWPMSESHPRSLKVIGGHQRSFVGNVVIDPDLTFKRSSKVKCNVIRGHKMSTGITKGHQRSVARNL
jgi:hypothetical protein